MLYKHKYFLLVVAIVFFTISGCKPKDAFTQKGAKVIGDAPTNTGPIGPAQFCPQPEDLIKQNDFWVSKDNRWKSYTPSSSTRVINFTGAQWAGVKIGKIICLYQANEAVAFPLALEQESSQPIIEPSGGGWSSLTGNRKFCKSASVADCSYFPEPQRDNSNIYKDIEYNPSAAKEETL